MALTRTKFQRILKIALALLVVCVIAGFAVYRSLPYARGPQIIVFTPLDGTTAASSTVDVVGRGVRINSLSLNGLSLSVDESGNFKKTVIAFPGLNFITLQATDQFGRSVTKQIRIYGQAAR